MSDSKQRQVFRKSRKFSKKLKMESLKSFQEDYLMEVDIDPFIKELAPDPLIDELNQSEPFVRYDRGDYVDHPFNINKHEQ